MRRFFIFKYATLQLLKIESIKNNFTNLVEQSNLVSTLHILLD